MKILNYICSSFLFLSLITTTYAQKESIPSLDGIIKLKAAEIDQQSGEQLYYTVVDVTLPEGLTIEHLAASTGIKVEDKWRETFSFFEKEGSSSTEMKKFYVEENTLRFEMGLLPEKYKIRVILYESKIKRYYVKLEKFKIKTKKS